MHFLKSPLSVVAAGAFTVLAISPVASASLIVNGDFETGTWTRLASPSGWTQNSYSFANQATETATVHGGQQSFLQFPEQAGATATVPVLFQAFDIGTAPSFEVSLWIKGEPNQHTGVTTQGAIRIREAGLGDAGTVRFYDGTDWTENSVKWAHGSASAPSPYHQGDTFGIRTDYTVRIQQTEWTHVTLTVPALAGVTTYAIDLGSVLATANSRVYWDDVSVVAVPEPMAAAALLPAVAATLARRRRHR